MIRKIIHIDKEKCNGCGLCAEACHEGAIGMVDGKATLLRDDYCDGLDDCLPACPVNAITFVEREAAAYDEVAVKARMAEMGQISPAGRYPGANAHAIQHATPCDMAAPHAAAYAQSQPSQWPVQIKLAPVNAPFLSTQIYLSQPIAPLTPMEISMRSSLRSS